MILIEFLRQFRFGGYAIFDFVIAFLGIYLLSPLLSKIFLKFRIDIPKQNWCVLHRGRIKPLRDAISQNKVNLLEEVARSTIGHYVYYYTEPLGQT